MHIAAYYFPDYHQDKRNRPVHGEGWNEWELIKNSCSKGEKTDFAVPYYPDITVAWDKNPRYLEDFTPVMVNTPENFRENLTRVIKRLKSKAPEHRILTVNAWNEWTEGRYLEPDTKNKFAYLEAIKSALNQDPENHFRILSAKSFSARAT